MHIQSNVETDKAATNYCSLAYVQVWSTVSCAYKMFGDRERERERQTESERARERYADRRISIKLHFFILFCDVRFDEKYLIRGCVREFCPRHLVFAHCHYYYYY